MNKQIITITIIISIILIFVVSGFSLYAQTSPVKGDVNNDGTINILDALLIAQYTVGLSPNGFYTEAADVDGNDTINIVDALLVARYYVGLISQFPVQATVGGVEVVKSDVNRNMSPQPAEGDLDAVVEGNNQFGFDCFRIIREQPDNIFFSPVSISYAFAMCYAGARGNTETEIARTLHFTLQGERFHNAYNSLDLTLTSEPANPNPDMGEDLKLHIANSIWGQKDYFFYPEFLDILAYHYGAGLNTVDFFTNSEQCRLLINDWVSNQTEERIKDLLPSGSVTPLTRMVLTNAIYFKATWYYPFDEDNTNDESFYLLSGNTSTIPMMHQILNTIYYEVAGQYQAVKLNYQGQRRNSMIIVMPAEGNYTSFENSFTYNIFKEIIQEMTAYRVILTLPKFTYRWGGTITSVLKSLGMTESFDSSLADFSGITNEEKLFISDVIHKAFVGVDENGTEAAAATAIVMTGSAPNPPTPPPAVTMTINRPFIFFIYNENTGTILFMGRVLEPEV
jgi:serpin B